MTAFVILNPYAGRWKAQQKREEVEKTLREAKIDYKIVATEHPGHGSELAATAVREGFSPVISAGGDGSISEVVNGMLQGAGSPEDNQSIPFGVIPLGTANDFSVNLHLPLDIPAAIQVIARGEPRNIDIGEVCFGTEKHRRYFDNNSAIGLEPSITLIQQRITRLRGVLRYLVATLIGVYHNPQWTMQIDWEGGRYQGMANLVTVGNSPLTGGLFYMTPHASPYDGLLTFVYGAVPTRLKILSILPKTMKPGEGSYVEHPSIREIHSPWVRIHSETPTPLHADGEIQSETVQDLEYRVLPACLPVLM
jgi:YegS/Rv2252/BmrU family lipid kinase